MEEKRAGKLIGVQKFIEELRENRNFRNKEREFEALREWEEIVGKRLAAHTVPLCVTDGNLYVRAEGAVWCQEIAFRKNEIKKKLNDIMGYPLITDIRYRVEE